jgi:exodeoxyribonuclease VII small subunit
MERLFDDNEATIEVTAEYSASKEVDSSVGSPEDSDSKDERFGDQLKELESIVSQLEGGQLDLEDSLKSYEEGVALIRSLQTKLADAEQKVQVMMGEISSAGE